MAYIPASNSVVGFQSQPSSLLVGASVIGLTPVNVVNMPSPSVIAYQLAGSVLAVSGSFSAGNTSVTAFQGGAWSASITGGYVNVIGSLIAVQAGGFAITSVMNTIPSSMMVGASIFGTVPVTQVTSPWVINMPSPSVVSVNIAGSVLAVRTDNASVVAVLSNSSVTTLQGTNPWQVNVPTSSYISYQLAGSVMAVSATVNTGNSSVQLLQSVAVIGSVAVLQGTSPWLVNVPTPSYLSIQPAGSVLNVNVSGSVAAAVTNFSASVAANINVISASIMVNQGTNPWVIGSIVGTYAEDAASSSGDKGLFVMGVRNDTMSSMTSADLDYSSHIVGPTGEMITANSPITKWVSGTTSVMYGTSVQVLAAPGTSIFTYITGLNVINESANLSRVTITQGLGRVPASMLTWAIAPAGGGSNATFPNPIRVLDNNGISASISGISSVYVTITGFTAKT